MLGERREIFPIEICIAKKIVVRGEHRKCFPVKTEDCKKNNHRNAEKFPYVTAVCKKEKSKENGGKFASWELRITERK